MKPTGKQLLTLVGNPDVYAVQHEDGSWHPVRERLTAKVLRAHRAGEVTVGTYIVSPPDQARTLVFDIDSPSGAEQREQAGRIMNILSDLGVHYGLEFSGKKGLHIWVVAADYMDAAALYRIGRGIREEAELPDLEVFPKQTEVKDLGNLVKMPGGVHRVTGNANDFIDEGDDSYPGGVGFPELMDVEYLEHVAEKYPEVAVRKRRGEAPPVIMTPCVWEIQQGVKEGGRNIHLFHLAAMLYGRSILPENVEAIVRRANELGEPLPEEELEQLLDNAQFSGPICNQLDDTVHCGEQCILSRSQGLHPRRGALRYAAEGEPVVVEVGDRTEGGVSVELVHPDMVQGRAFLAEPKRKKRDRDAD